MSKSESLKKAFEAGLLSPTAAAAAAKDGRIDPSEYAALGLAPPSAEQVQEATKELEKIAADYDEEVLNKAKEAVQKTVDEQKAVNPALSNTWPGIILYAKFLRAECEKIQKEQKRDTSKGKRRARKQKRQAKDGIFEQTHQNYLLQNIDKLMGNAPEPDQLPLLNIVTTKTNLVNKLTTKEHVSSLMNATPRELSSLTPFIRFFKRDEKDGKIRLREFKLSKSSQNLDEYLSRGASGGDVGLKDFSINMTGTNSFTATRNYQGKLTLFFRSVGDMKPPTNLDTDKELAWTEMLFSYMFPSTEDLESANNSISEEESEEKKQEKALAFLKKRKAQIYVQFGYDASSKAALADNPSLYNAIQKTRMILALYPISTNFSFEQDGSVELAIDFTAASEARSDDGDSNILELYQTDATREKIKKLKENIKKLKKKVDESSERKTKGQKKSPKEKAQDQLARKEKELEEAVLEDRLASYGRVIEYLYTNKRLFSVTAYDGNYKKGWWGKKFPSKISAQSKTAGKEVASKSKKKAKKDENLDETRDKWGRHTIGFFFLGDLLNYAAHALIEDDKQKKDLLDRVFKSKSTKKKTTPPNVEMIAEVVLGDYTYYRWPKETDYKKNPAAWIQEAKRSIYSTNLSKLPISYSLFHSFMRNVVVNNRGSVLTFDQFLKQAIERLVVAAMDSAVVGRTAAPAKKKIERRGGHQIVRVTGDAPKILEKKGVEVVDLDREEVSITTPITLGGLLGIGAEPKDAPKDWIIIHGSRKPIVGNVGQNLETDIKEHGINHLYAGSRLGIVKSVNFKQTSTRLKEINLQKQLAAGGISDPLQILRMPYDADVAVFGNPGFHPGQFVWIRPSYVGVGDVTLANSIAGQFGLGGLYNIIGVSTRISPGVFETTLNCVQNNSAIGQGTEKKGEQSDSQAGKSENIEEQGKQE